MKRPAFVWALPGLLGVASAAALLLWPITGPGVTGNAVRPNYSREFAFGFHSYEQLPENPTPADLKKAGVTLPRDRVAERRKEAAVALASGMLLLTGGLNWREQRRRT